MTAYHGLSLALVERSLKNFVEDTTGIACIWMRDRGPQPDLPYVGIDWLVPPSKFGMDDTPVDSVDTSNRNIRLTLCGPRRATITLHVFSASTKPDDSAFVYASALQTKLTMERSRRRFFTPGGIGIAQVSDVQNATAPRDGTTKWVSHVLFDVDLNLVSNMVDSDAVEYIESTEVDGDVDGVSFDDGDDDKLVIE